jgi:hypothetical protein
MKYARREIVRIIKRIKKKIPDKYPKKVIVVEEMNNVPKISSLLNTNLYC